MSQQTSSGTKGHESKNCTPLDDVQEFQQSPAQEAFAGLHASPGEAKRADNVSPNYLDAVIERAASEAMESGPHARGAGGSGRGGGANLRMLEMLRRNPAVSDPNPAGRGHLVSAGRTHVTPTPPLAPPPDFTARRKRASP